MKNKSTITEVSNQNDASNEKVRRKDNSCEDTPSPMGRLQKRYDKWEKVTSSPFILSVIREGYKLPFKDICGYFQCAPFPRLQTGKVVWVLSFDPKRIRINTASDILMSYRCSDIFFTK